MPVNAGIRSELINLVPYGLVVTRGWLMEKGLKRHSIDNLVKSEQLLPLCQGVYKRPETKLKWQGVVCSVQRMGSDLTLGGLSALALHGYAHYLSLSQQKTVHLYGADKLPSWANKLIEDVKFVRHSDTRLLGHGLYVHHDFDGKKGTTKNLDPLLGFTTEMPGVDESWPLTVSSPERALFEVLSDVPERVSFEHADQLMQGLSTLSPRRLEKLLARTGNVKVKRLFFWFADRHRHAWCKKLDSNDFDLGKGKRMLTKGGKLDKKYQITVPEEMYG